MVLVQQRGFAIPAESFTNATAGYSATESLDIFNSEVNNG